MRYRTYCMRCGCHGHAELPAGLRGIERLARKPALCPGCSLAVDMVAISLTWTHTQRGVGDAKVKAGSDDSGTST